MVTSHKMQMQRYGWRTIPTWLSQKQRSLRKEGLLWKMVKPRPADSAAVAWTHESCGRMDGNRWERWLSLSVEHAILSLNLGFNRVHWQFFLVVSGFSCFFPDFLWSIWPDTNLPQMVPSDSVKTFHRWMGNHPRTNGIVESSGRKIFMRYPAGVTVWFVW